MKTVIISKPAEKQLRSLPPQIAKRLRDKIDQLGTAPEALANNISALKGMNAYRLRVGNYRVIFDDDGTVIAVLSVKHRKDAYR